MGSCMTEEIYNAADPKKVKRREDKAKRERDSSDDDLKALLQLPQFRRFLWRHICGDCQIFQTQFSPNGSLFAHNTGRQSIGLEMLSRVEKIDPALIPQMMMEYAEWQA